jgi:hypothetical protein
VEKTPALPDAAAPDSAAAAAAASTVVEFVGVRCHVNCGAHDYWPRVVRFKASIAALQVRAVLYAVTSRHNKVLLSTVIGSCSMLAETSVQCASRRPSLRCK